MKNINIFGILASVNRFEDASLSHSCFDDDNAYGWQKEEHQQRATQLDQIRSISVRCILIIISRILDTSFGIAFLTSKMDTSVQKILV